MRVVTAFAPRVHGVAAEVVRLPFWEPWFIRNVASPLPFVHKSIVPVTDNDPELRFINGSIALLPVPVPHVVVSPPETVKVEIVLVSVAVKLFEEAVALSPTTSELAVIVPEPVPFWMVPAVFAPVLLRRVTALVTVSWIPLFMVTMPPVEPVPN